MSNSACAFNFNREAQRRMRLQIDRKYSRALSSWLGFLAEEPIVGNMTFCARRPQFWNDPKARLAAKRSIGQNAPQPGQDLFPYRCHERLLCAKNQTFA
jgi:hypothetical protein